MNTHKPTNLLSYNSYRLCAIAEQAYTPTNISELEDALASTSSCASKVIVIGGGTNIILSKPYYDKRICFIITTSMDRYIHWDGCICTASSSVPLQALIQESLDKKLKGLEKLAGIPGTVGGAIFMNAGAYGIDIHQHVLAVKTYDPTNKKYNTFNKEQLKSNYRSSIFQVNKEIIIETSFKLTPSSTPEFEAETSREILSRRNRTLPHIFPNAGSVFKRPASGLRVGEIMEALGMKRFRIGGAMISDLHGGFIVNISQANGCDIINLAELMKKTAREKLNTHLELEQIII